MLSSGSLSKTRVGNAVPRHSLSGMSRCDTLGMRFDEGGRSLAYSVDFSEMTAEMKELYEGSDIWIADCLSRRPHPTHAHLGLVLDSARELGIGEVYLVHMGNSLDYHTLVDELPSNIRPAHDELEIDL